MNTTSLEIKSTGYKKSANQLLSKYGIYFALVIIFVVLSFVSDTFFTTTNLINVLKQASIVSVIAIGMSFCLITGGFDLSAGSVMALSGVVSAMLAVQSGVPIGLALGAAIAVGALCGLINGVLVAKGGIAPFIVTLGMMLAVRGVALVITNANPVFGLPKSFTYIGSGKLGSVPVLVIVTIIVLVIAYVLLEKTRFGRHVYAIGGNEKSAHVSGIGIVKTKIWVYIIMGALSGLGGLMLAGRIQNGNPTMAEGYELDAIAGAVIGGISTSGGIGRIHGAVIGALLLTIISNGLDLLNVSSHYQQIVKGAIIIAAVLFDVKSKRTKGE